MVDQAFAGNRGLYRAAGIAGVVAGIVTAAIIILPYVHGAPPDGERFALHSNPWYMFRQWLSFLNIFAILFASLGLAVHRFRASPGAASGGMLFLLFYGCTELLGRSVMIFTREYNWIHNLAEAEGDTRDLLLGNIEFFDDVWGGLFRLILITFTVSAFLFGWATRGGGRLQRVTSWSLFAAAALGAVTFMVPFLTWIRPVALWGYVFIQPASRLIVGFFLLRESRLEQSCLAKSRNPVQFAHL